MSIIFGLVFFPLYLGWIVYRGLFKKDIKQHKNDFYTLTLFMIVWSLIYYWLFF